MASGNSGTKLGGLIVGTIAVVAAAGAAYLKLSPEKVNREVATQTVERGDLRVTVTEQGTLESSNNTEVKCRVRGKNTITWVVPNGTRVKKDQILVQLDTLLIEEEISERTKYAHLADATASRSKADVERAELAISEYLDGRYVTELAGLQKDKAIAKARLSSAKNRLSHAKMMARNKYASELRVEQIEFEVTQADLDVKLADTKISVLEKFTKEEELATLRGELAAAKALHDANVERAFADHQRLKRAQEELKQCTVRAKREGIVIYPSGPEWKDAPEIEEGAVVHKDQVLLLMPDLKQMQVKVGIHESLIDRVRPGLLARVTLQGKTIDAELSQVASVAKPAGWWTGNVVKYETIVELPGMEGLKPGMTVEVEVVIAEHADIVKVPLSAVVETNSGHAVWVGSDGEIRRRTVEIGDSSKMFIQVTSGLESGENIVLDPLANIEEAQVEAAAVPEPNDLSSGSSAR